MVINNISAYTPMIHPLQESIRDRNTIALQVEAATDATLIQSLTGWPTPTTNQITEQEYGQLFEAQNASLIETALQSELLNAMVVSAMDNRDSPLQNINIESTLLSYIDLFGQIGSFTGNYNIFAIRRELELAYQHIEQSPATDNNAPYPHIKALA